MQRLLFAVFTTIAAAAPVVRGAQTNVVILLADDLGYGDVSRNGGVVPTPNIDGLIDQGVELQTFFVQPVCSPTRAALMTGRDPARVGVNPQVVNPRAGQMMIPAPVRGRLPPP